MINRNVAAGLCRTLLTFVYVMYATCGAAALICLYSHSLNQLYLIGETALALLPVLVLLQVLSRILSEYSISTYIEAVYIVTLTWIFSALIATIPFLLSHIDFLDSFFECVSGLTGTGLTVMKNVAALPILLKLWRAVLQWVGEIGIVVVFIVFLARPGSPITYLYLAEGRERIEVTIWRTTKIMVRIYVLYTLICALLYFIAGIDLFNSVCMAMTTIATGGFTNYNVPLLNIISHIRFPLLFYVSCIIMMMLGAMNFRDHARLFTGKFKEAFSPELRAFLIVSAVLSVLTILSYMYFDKYSMSSAIFLGLFHEISALTTTGFQLTGLRNLSPVTKLLIITAMVIGGCTCSTAGGIKIFRLTVLFKAVGWNIEEVIKPPGALIRRTIGPIKLEDKDINRVLMFVLLYIFILFISAIIVTACGHSFINSLFECASALGCVGLSVGITSASASPICKIVLIIDMLSGRLEIMPWLTLLSVAISRLRAERKKLKTTLVEKLTE
ncbi:MAG: TrkH family potassium uptake protein [Crenarchaeota archaeon]|nr:TrkH family potassium uptake protein [Thermoproteota archaeon]